MFQGNTEEFAYSNELSDISCGCLFNSNVTRFGVLTVTRAIPTSTAKLLPNSLGLLLHLKSTFVRSCIGGRLELLFFIRPIQHILMRDSCDLGTDKVRVQINVLP